MKSRGLTINDEVKAREILLDIGYYRLGFYLFPFEKTFPNLHNRTHEYIPEATFEDAVNLYYFDFNLRLLLLRYLTRIEIAFRTALIYNLSNKYREHPVWFVNPTVVSSSYANEFEQKVYTDNFKRIPIIRRHHLTNPNDRFAPPWKTLEFMTFGAVLKLHQQLKELEDKIIIANNSGYVKLLHLKATCKPFVKFVMHVLMDTCYMTLNYHDESIEVLPDSQQMSRAT